MNEALFKHYLTATFTTLVKTVKCNATRTGSANKSSLSYITTNQRR